MRSAASYRGHPIHPALIPFPFAFLIGAFAFDAASWLAGWPAGWTTGSHLALAGVIMALVAAVPGFIDYVYSVPPESSGKRRATRHMLLNLSAVVLVGLALLLRGAAATLVIVGIEGLGVGLLVVGGWMGGTLVSRNQISVDHRYADAGKWREATIEAERGVPVRVAGTDELSVDQMKLLHVGGRRIVLARDSSGYVAFDDRCSHKGASLADGALICGTVQCPWHGSQFDVRSGELKAGPAKKKIATFQIQTRGNDVLLTL